MIADLNVPLNFTEWSGALQAFFLAIVSLVSEDLAVTGGAGLALSGTMTLRDAFLGVFLGIWLGDGAIFGVARSLGRPFLQRPRVQRWISKDHVDRAEEWFQRRGLMVLVASRFLPGTRLATFAAAGFLGVGILQFMVITGVCALIWCAAVFWMILHFGEQVIESLGGSKNGFWVVLALLAVVYMIVHFLPMLATKESRRRLHGQLLRWTRWEFWPPWLFYALPFLNYMRLSALNGSLTIPTAANPSIPFGGFIGESKIHTLRQLQEFAPEYTLNAILLDPRDTELAMHSLRNAIETGKLNYPVVLKPDVGQRGVGVKFANDEGEAREYLEAATWPTIAQQRSKGDFEIGALYYRFPNEEKGRIFSITDKQFPKVIGDGHSTLGRLIDADPRERFMADKYYARFRHELDRVIPEGEEFRLAKVGNHAQGCVFLDGERLITPELEAQIDALSRRIPGFYFGRFDLRFASEEELKKGVGFEIIELNGAGSESTNIYDPKNNLLAAYKILYKQWNILFEIGKQNRRNGYPTTPPKAIIKYWRQSLKSGRSFPVSD